MRVSARNVQAVAWSVLLGAFAVFLALAIGLPWLAVRAVRTATASQPVTVERLAGSVALQPPAGMHVLLQSGAPQQVAEGVTIATGGDGRAFVRFPDDSTVNLDPDTSLLLRRVRRPRFATDLPRRVTLYAVPSRGQMAGLSVGTTWGDLVFDIETDHGRVRVGPESHARLDIDAARLRVVCVDGRVEVFGAGEPIVLGRDQRTVVEAGAPPHAVPALEDIVANGEFDAPPGPEGGWEFGRYPDGAPNPGESAHGPRPDGRTVVAFLREGSAGSSADMFYQQSLDRHDVAEATYLGITATLRVLGQSLPGGGDRSTEYPLLLKLIYDDAAGNIPERPWSVGFYAVAPAADKAEFCAECGVLVPRSEWTTFGTGNLLDSANHHGFERRGLPRPARLLRLEVVSSGHDYESEIDSVGVWVK